MEQAQTLNNAVSIGDILEQKKKAARESRIQKNKTKKDREQFDKIKELEKRLNERLVEKQEKEDIDKLSSIIEYEEIKTKEPVEEPPVISADLERRGILSPKAGAIPGDSHSATFNYGGVIHHRK